MSTGVAADGPPACTLPGNLHPRRRDGLAVRRGHPVNFSAASLVAIVALRLAIARTTAGEASGLAGPTSPRDLHAVRWT
jgi:hypothetical protein